jgi:hypothetical protein
VTPWQVVSSVAGKKVRDVLPELIGVLSHEVPRGPQGSPPNVYSLRAGQGFGSLESVEGRVWRPWRKHPSHDLVVQIKSGHLLEKDGGPAERNCPGTLEDPVSVLGNFSWAHYGGRSGLGEPGQRLLSQVTFASGAPIVFRPFSQEEGSK